MALAKMWFTGSCETGGTLECDLREGECFAFGQKDYLCQHTTVWIGTIVDGKMIELSNQGVLKKLREEENNDGETTDGCKGVDGKRDSR